MKTPTQKIISILSEFVRAHRERGDANERQQYASRLTRFVESMEDGSFQKLPPLQQKRDIFAIHNEYLGRGEVFWLLAPKYIELEYEKELDRAIKDYISEIDSLND